MAQVACIFIDGENLRHSIVELFQEEFAKPDYLPRNADWKGLFEFLVMQADADTRLRTYWYVVENIDFWPWGIKRLSGDVTKLHKVLLKDRKCRQELQAIPDQTGKDKWAQAKATELVSRERRMKSRFDGWKEFQDGISHRFDSVEFRRAGSIHYNLFTQRLGKEKAVDVNLATDLLELRNIYDIGVIVSGDQDYVPAVRAAKDSGKQIINVSFMKRDGSVLPGGARRLNQTTDRTIEMSYADLKKFTRFPAAPQSLKLAPTPVSASATHE